MVFISTLSFFTGIAQADNQLELAEALYEEGDWARARAEALRVWVAEPTHPLAQGIAAWSSLRLNPKHEEAAQTAWTLARDHEDSAFRARAAYEWGRIRWDQGDPIAAFCLIKHAFLHADDQLLVLKSAYSLDVLLWRQRDLAPRDDPLWNQLRTTRPLLTPAIRAQAAPPAQPKNSWVMRPAFALVRFYQTQISPAIGQRCSMHPSCSAYCIEACRNYGLVGIAMTGDRLIRESDHVVHRINPIMIDGEEKYYNPVSDHTFWFRRYQR